MSLLSPPVCSEGMTELNREFFSKDVSVPSLQLDVKTLNKAMPYVKKYMLKIIKLKPVKDCGTNKKVIFLNPEVVKEFNSLPENCVKKLNALEVTEKDFSFATIRLTYDNWKLNEILQAAIPYPISSYSTVGHIIHVNLRPEHIPFKKIIGEVLLDKVTNCTSVVNKMDSIGNAFRVFQMEVIAGDNNLVTTAKENGCSFHFDFSEVYWNPRLSTEHERIVSKLRKGDILYDVFCGVGPFAIPAAKKGCHVLANDLNAACYKWLKFNVCKNNVEPSSFVGYNRDGFNFITENVASHYLETVKSKSYTDDTKVHVTMNLPSLSHEFLPAFKGLFSCEDVKLIPDNMLFIIHLYLFLKNETDLKLASVNKIKERLNITTENILEIHHVRDVAPNKEMICISFVISKTILEKDDSLDKRNIDSNSISPDINVKKQKISE